MDNKVNDNRNSDSDVIQLLASIMICYPRISKVCYDGKRREITFGIAIKLPEDTDAFVENKLKVLEGMIFFQELEGVLDAAVDIGYHDCTLQIKRDIESISRREIDLMLYLINEHFSYLLFPEDEKKPDDEVAATQLELMDVRIRMINELEIAASFVGIREESRVMVYDRI